MLSSEKNGLHARQKQHRRQQSTPNAFQGVNVPSLPNNRQQAGHHRRGQSLDIRRQQPTHQTARQAMHVLREAQQQRLQARPGTQHYYANLAPSGSENYLISPHASQFDPSYFDPNVLALNPYAGGLLMMQRGQVEYGDNMTDCRDSGLFNSDSALSTPTFSTFPDSPIKQGWSSEDDTSSTGTLRRVSRGISGRVHKFEKMGADGFSRPITPPNQNVQGYFPPTPVETPHNRFPKIEPATRSRFEDGHDESMEVTLKPVRTRGKTRAEDVFEDMKQQVDTFSSPRANTLANSESFTTLHMPMDNINEGFMRLDPDLDRCQSEPHGLELPAHPSQNTSSNTTTQISQFIPMSEGNCEPASYRVHAMHKDMSADSSRRGSPHRRTESIASMMSAASIAGLDIEATKTETGISLEQISKYMEGPDPEDGKWKCLYEDCDKKFGRKENIKSHIQTHLGDRQYKCPECQKPFVRQHDLKRHAKIHSGYKPYECRCGNSFARQDALTRHKQRGMCIGGVAGVVRKNNRRGRPPKNSRPDMETRQEKSAKTRQKNMSISSMSDFSDSSHANSPADYNDIFDDLNMSSVNSQMQNMEMPSTAPMVSYGPSTSAANPAVMSASSPVDGLVSGVSMERISSQESFASDFNTPPGLSQSASPQSVFWSDPPNVSGSSDPLSSMAVPSELLHDDEDEDLMTRFTNEDNVMALDSNDVKFETEYTPFDVNNLTLFGDDLYMGSM
ncbi:Fc.00g014160.m01.CDS01 [Cosmosporella sp. VM-42]